MIDRIDIHSHILPGIDDGSRDVAESRQLLEMLSRQGVTVAAATPHFYANRQSVTEFLERRQAACEQLLPGLPADAPRILLGAEVRYYEGISRLPQLEQLKIQGSSLLLLEMPMETWSEHTVGELMHLSGSGTMQILIAHIERSLPRQKSGTLERLARQGILFQANATWFLQPLARHQALANLRAGRIHMLGSDCHSVKGRPPRLGEACGVIEKKFGEDFLRQMHRFSCRMLNLSENI